MSGIELSGQYCLATVVDPDVERARAVEAMMRDHLSREQMIVLRDVLDSVFSPSDGGAADNADIVAAFLQAKAVENCSKRTIENYGNNLRRALAIVGKPVRFMDASDIRAILAACMARGCSPATVNNVRRVLSTFFQWLEDEDVIRKSPVKKVKQVKVEKSDKRPFSDEDVELLRGGCSCERDRAIVELLLSSGMRLSEMCGLDVSDVDLSERECEVLGKGNKRRMCYFSAAAALYLGKYLDSRDDDDPALFVGMFRPHARLQASGVEIMVRSLGKRVGVENAHPHRFRRTMATNCLKKGMDIEEIQLLLGHENINTTLIYAKVDKEKLRFNARRLA